MVVPLVSRRFGKGDDRHMALAIMIETQFPIKAGDWFTCNCGKLDCPAIARKIL